MKKIQKSKLLHDENNKQEHILSKEEFKYLIERLEHTIGRKIDYRAKAIFKQKASKVYSYNEIINAIVELDIRSENSFVIIYSLINKLKINREKLDNQTKVSKLLKNLGGVLGRKKI